MLSSLFSDRPAGVSRYGFLLAALFISTAAASPAQTRIQAREADRFVGSMGINVHLESSTAPYSNYTSVNAKLRLLGMRHIRDEMNDTDGGFVGEIQEIGKMGYSLTGLIEGGNDYPPSGKLNTDDVLSLIRGLEPTIDSVEGPNEPDGGGFVYAGTPYPQGAINEAEDLWRIVKGNPETAHLPVIALSEGSAPDVTQLSAIAPPPVSHADYGNMHAYQGGDVGDNQLAGWYMPYARFLTGCGGLWTTEMGYHNNTRYLDDTEQQGVSERASAIYLPIAFLSGFDRGVMRTFSYELIDEANDPDLTSGSGEGHYGLLHYDFSPKPAFAAMRNLIALLAEPGAKRFEPGMLEVTFSGAPATLRYTLLQKSTGTFYLALWNDVSVYQTATSQAAGKDLHPPEVPVRLTFATPRAFTVYAPNDLSGTNPAVGYTVSTTARSIELKVPAEVLLVRIESR